MHISNVAMVGSHDLKRDTAWPLRLSAVRRLHWIHALWPVGRQDCKWFWGNMFTMLMNWTVFQMPAKSNLVVSRWMLLRRKTKGLQWWSVPVQMEVTRPRCSSSEKWSIWGVLKAFAFFPLHILQIVAHVWRKNCLNNGCVNLIWSSSVQEGTLLWR